MALSYSYTRPSGLTRRRVTSTTAISAAAELEAVAAPKSLSPQAIAAMTDPGVIRPLLDCALEVESNRLQRATTTVLKRGDTLAAVGVWDPATMTVASLSTGRRNPTRRFALADVSIADESTVFDTDGSEEIPVAFADPISLVDEVPGGYPGGSDPAWTWTGGAGVTVANTASSVTPTFSGGAYVRRLSHATALPAGVLNSPSRTVSYYLPANAERRFTMSAALRLSTRTSSGVTGTLVGRLRVTYTTSLGTFTAYGPSFTLTEPPSAGLGSWQRVVAPWAPAVQTSAATMTAVRLELEIFSTTNLLAVDQDAGELYAGPDRGQLVGRHAAIPAVAGVTTLAVIEQTWTGTRQVNRVEIAGERRLGRISSARVDVLDSATGTWVTAGADGGGGKLAILFDRTIVAQGVRVYVEEATGDPGGRVWVVEVDPMLVLDVTDDVKGASLKWSRDARDTTNPYGNYQGASAMVELDNTTGTYTPAKNASLGAGHRLEIAVGARWTNLVGNGRADVDLSGEVAAYTPNSGNTARSYPAPPGAPVASALTRSVSGAGNEAPIGVRVPIIGGRTYRASVYVRADSSDPAGYVYLGVRGTGVDGTSGLGALTGSTSGVAVGAGWRKITTATFVPTLPAGIGYADLEVWGHAASAAAVQFYATCFELVELDSAGVPVATDELVPAGVFYCEPWAAPSDTATVQIDAADRLGRFGSTKIDEEVRQAVTVERLVRDLALLYLDMDDDQVGVSSSPGSYSIPYAYPSGNLGSYLADLAKASLATLYVDPAERLLLSPIGYVASAPVAEIRADNALIRSSKPNAVDTTIAVVTVTASPLKQGAVADLWSLPDGGVTIPGSGSRVLFVNYSSAPAINAYLTGVTADGAYTIASAYFYADHAIVTVSNPGAGVLTLQTATVRGTPLDEQPLAAQVVDAPSRARFGARELAVDARLVQTQTQLDLVASVLLDAFRGIDSSGTRRLPVLELDSLGLLHVDLDDVVTVFDPAIGVGADYLLTSRELSFEGGHLLTLNATAQQAPTVSFAIADTSIADDVYVAGY